MVAASLDRLGARYLALIDTDRLEEHSLREMEAVRPDDLGKPKVQALAGALRARPPEGYGAIRSIAVPLTDPEALAAAKEREVICSCPDNDAARLAAAVIAALYHKALLDIGTGVLFPEGAFAAPGSTTAMPISRWSRRAMAVCCAEEISSPTAGRWRISASSGRPGFCKIGDSRGGPDRSPR